MRMLPLGVPPLEGLMALIAGLLGAAAFPPLGFWYLSLASLCLFLAVVRNQSTETARNVGLVYGLALAGGTMYWFFNIFHFFAVPLLAIMAAYFGLLGHLIALTRSVRPLVRAALVAVFAVGIEWLRGDAWYLRFPWYTVPHALALEPACIASARWLGTYGLSFVIWLIAGLGAFSSYPYWLVFFLIPAPSWVLPELDAGDKRALLLQTEVPEGVEHLIPKVTAESVDLAVLPEYAYLSSVRVALASEQGPAALARKLDCPVVFGAVEGRYGEKGFVNIAVVFDRHGRLVGTFQKQRPIPLMNDGVAGTERPVFPLEQGVLGVAVCYDFDAPAIAASLVRSGATVLVSPTYDAMHWGRIQHVHHAQLQRLRAVENDRWLLRAASSGRSEAVDPHGRPSEAGIEIGEVGQLIVAYGHRDTFALGGQLAFLGPAMGVGTLAYLVAVGLVGWRTRQPRVGHPASLDAGHRQVAVDVSAPAV